MKKKEIPNESGRIQRTALKELFNFVINESEETVNVENDPFEVIVFDTETSGLDNKNDKIVQISGIKFECVNGKFTEKERFDTFINQPEYDENKVIPDKAFEAEHGRQKTFFDLTGINRELLEKYGTEDEIFPKVYAFFGDNPIVCGHNTPFDYGFLTEMYIRHGKNFLSPATRRLDTLALARDLIPRSEAPKKVEDGKERATYTLGALAAMYGIDKSEEDDSEVIGFHNSMNDVIVTSRLLQVLIYEFAQRELKEGLDGGLAAASLTKERAMVKSISYWEGYRGFSRIYVNAILRGQTVGYFYDVRKKIWGERDEGTIVATDMEAMIKDALELAGVEDEYNFGKIKTEIKADAEFLKRYKTS